MAHSALELPTPECEVFFARLGGAVNRVATNATAYPHRDAEFVMNAHIRWRDTAEDEACVQWGRVFHAATEPYATGGVYSNFVPEGDDAAAAFGDNGDRLRAIKQRYDPNNLCRVNINVAPADDSHPPGRLMRRRLAARGAN